jgi:chromosome segregation ATPase
MTDEELTQAMAELQEVVRCRCDEAYRDRGLKDPHCECDSADAVKVVADRIKAITEQLAAAQDDAKEAEAYAEEVEKERDDYALKLMQAINTYTEMHLDIERLSDKLATCEKYRDAYDEMGRIGTQAVRDLEAKLAKAVEAMEFWLQAQEPDFDAAIDLMQATLAELKGRPRG